MQRGNDSQSRGVTVLRLKYHKSYGFYLDSFFCFSLITVLLPIRFGWLVTLLLSAFVCLFVLLCLCFCFVSVFGDRLHVVVPRTIK